MPDFTKQRRKPRRQRGTIGWIMERHMDANSQLKSIESNEADPQEAITKIAQIQRTVNSWTRELNIGLDYREMVFSAINRAIENTGIKDGIPLDMREGWKRDIQRLKEPGELEREVSMVSMNYPGYDQNRIKEFYMQAVEHGEPFLRERIKERLVSIRNALMRK